MEGFRKFSHNCIVISFSAISLLYAQLQAHMMSHEMANICNCHDILGLRGQQALNNLAQSLCCCALQLFSQVSNVIISPYL